MHQLYREIRRKIRVMGIMKFAPEALKNLFKKPVTTTYPAEPAVYPERSRGHVAIDVDGCISCGICQLSCPLGAIKVDKKEGTWDIDRFDCIACGYCVEKCPKKCLSMVSGYQEPGREKYEDKFRRSAEAMAAEAEKKKQAALKAAAAKKALAEKKAREEAEAKAKAESNAEANAETAGEKETAE
jgi:formate hydrogenlyase subunit 6/NADH:ubiquinone oxidoreductase subunit I